MEKKFVQPQLNLRRVMGKKRVNDEGLANMIGLTRAAVNAIVCGRTSPSLKRLYQIADALEVHIFELFS